MNLEGCRNNLIGGTLGLAGISGGEQRRLSFACEVRLKHVFDII
jgi:hypothetical protein